MELPPDLLDQVLGDQRTGDAMRRALRDALIRRGFEAFRRHGLRVDDAVEVLAEQFCLSPARVRQIVYEVDTA